jgi:hypothetical protein
MIYTVGTDKLGVKYTELLLQVLGGERGSSAVFQAVCKDWQAAECEVDKRC